VKIGNRKNSARQPTRAVPSNTADRVGSLVFVWEEAELAARAVSGDTGRVWLQDFYYIFLFFSLTLPLLPWHFRLFNYF
jgi:hypothetical protein